MTITWGIVFGTILAIRGHPFSTKDSQWRFRGEVHSYFQTLCSVGAWFRQHNIDNSTAAVTTTDNN